MRSTKPVSGDLFVAMMIYHVTEVKKEPIWFSKLVELSKDYMDKITVSHSINTLCDWMIIYGEYGETEKGRAGRLWFIETHDGGVHTIKELYDKYWKQITGDEHG